MEEGGRQRKITKNEMLVGHRVKLAELKSQTMMLIVICCIAGQSPQSTLGNTSMKIQMRGETEMIILNST